jgi:benzodiazapine receptor
VAGFGIPVATVTVMTPTRTAFGFAGWVVLPYVAAVLGALYSGPEFYSELRRPGWSPPAWLFGPVWTVLYGMMGVAAGVVWVRHKVRGAGPALGLFLVQLLLNAIWSPLFFGLRRPDLALIDIVALWALIGATVVAFWRKRPVAGALLVPYWLWVSFATALNFEIWRLNG